MLGLQPQDTYGLEKLYAEEMVGVRAGLDIVTRRRATTMCMDHMGPEGRARKGSCVLPCYLFNGKFEMWGDGEQTRNMYVDDCVEGLFGL